MKLKLCLTALALVWAAGVPANAQENKAEVIHWWTSGGESAAVKVFAEQYTKAGGTWMDTAIAGGANARTAAINRTVGGTPPTAMQFNTGRQFDELVENDLLRDVDQLATEQKWKSVIPEAIVNAATRNGKMFAVPVGIHGQNWLWMSKAALSKAGASEPTNWDDVFPVLDKLKAAGLIPLAFSGQKNWERNLFNAVLVGKGGNALWTAIYGKRDPAAANSAAFKAVAETYGKLRAYVDPGSPGRNWNDATNLVIQGKAGMQIMGDWAKSEWTAAKKVAGKDYECVAFPGTDKAFTYNIDSLAVFKQKDAGTAAGQQDIAKIVLGENFQKVFSINKGSIPVRNDMLNNMDKLGFDSCAQTAAKDFLADAKSGGLQPSMAHNMATTLAVQGAFFDVVTNYINDPKADPADTAKKLGAAIKSSK